MRTVSASSNAIIFLGKKGENLATQVIFPFVKEWKELYGEGTFQLIYQRYGDALPYAVALTEDEENVIWPVTNTDVNVVGAGKCELQYYLTDEFDNHVLAKSMTFLTKVVESLDDAGEIPPEPWESWVEQVLAAGSDAEQSAVAAGEFADEAKDHADDAEESANMAGGYSDDARLSASNAAESAYQAALKASEASGYANNASGEADRASEYANNASSYKDLARGHSEEAERQAQNAAGSATRSNESSEASRRYSEAAAESAQEIEDLTVTSITLTPGSAATVNKTGGDGEPYNLEFGIPEGERGEKGDKGEKGDTGDCNFATFEIDPETGLLTATYSHNDSHIIFDLTTLGYLEVSINE